MNNIEVIRTNILNKPCVEETFPFGDEHAVYKVCGKMFVLMSLDEMPLRLNLKCDPELAIDLRDQYSEHVLPGYHMNKKHWNTIVVDDRIKTKLLNEWIDHSYQLVVAKLSKALKAQIQQDKSVIAIQCV